MNKNLVDETDLANYEILYNGFPHNLAFAAV